MKNIFKIHPFYYLVAIICVITGLFKDFIYITLLIFIHEMGHFIGALKYKWKVKKIVILPFGGVTIFNELLNKSLKEEFVILVLGPLFQIMFYSIICFIGLKSTLITSYHYSLLLFNMLPVIPLDGSKLLNILLNKIISFKNSHLITIYISVGTIILLIIKSIQLKNMMLILIIIFLSLKNIKELKEHKYLFNKFLYERYNYDLEFNKLKIIKNMNLSKMKKEYKHIFKKDRYYSEKEVLKQVFKY